MNVVTHVHVCYHQTTGWTSITAECYAIDFHEDPPARTYQWRKVLEVLPHEDPVPLIRGLNEEATRHYLRTINRVTPF